MATIDGTSGDDTLDGTLGDDTINGLAGDDTIRSFGGVDLIYGGEGNDEINGTWPGPLFYSFSGPITVYGDAGDDLIGGSTSVDLLDGGAGHDYLHGLEDDDLLSGGSGDDTLFGGDGDDTLLGGEGNDSLSGDDLVAGADLLFGEEGDDTLIGFGGNDFLRGGTGNDSLHGGDDDDVLRGSDGDDTLFGSPGNDLLFGGADADSLSGGEDDDYLDGGEGQDTLFGGLGNDTLLGFADRDELFGNEGDDLLDGGDGNDDLFGMVGNDTLIGAGGFDLLDGGEDDDTYILRGRDFRIFDLEGLNSIIVEEDFLKVPFTVDPTPVYGVGVMALPYWPDSLLADDANSFRSLLGGGTTIAYGFPDVIPGYTDPGADSDGWMSFNEAQRTFTVGVLDYVSSIVNLEFVETADFDAPNVMVFANNSQVGSAGYAYSPNGISTGSDVFINKDTAGNLAPTDGDGSALTYIHEISHALGLKHPFEGGPTLPDNDGDPSMDEDSTAWTVMSYDSFPEHYHATLQPLDIAALHYLYGPNPEARAGDDTYVISEAGPNFIWDGNGTDTVDATGASAAVTVYLEPGYWGFVGPAAASLITAQGQITVNFGTVIENLYGSSHDDTLVGNRAANVIQANDGNDTVDAAAGDDSVTGGNGDDSLDGGVGIDTAVFSGPMANYTISSDGSVYTVADNVGGDGTDTLNRFAYAQFNDGTVVLGLALGGLDGSDGFRLDGAAADDSFGYSVSSAGDVNGDSYDDLIIGARQADSNGADSGSTYIVFGTSSGMGGTFDLGSLDGSNGFRLDGPFGGIKSGNAVSSAGDVNGDGFDDLIIGARDADPHGIDSGSAYVVFGKSGGFAATLDLGTLDGSNGFRLDGEAPVDRFGHAVSAAGDVNGDGFGDVIVGARQADPNGLSNAGSSYVILGQAGGFTATVDVADLKGTDQNGIRGFRLDGVVANDVSGESVSAADVNGDGIDDLIIGAPQANLNADPNPPLNEENYGAAYVVFGKSAWINSTPGEEDTLIKLNLGDLDGTNGFRMEGSAAGEAAGESVSSAGDVNGDGVADLIVGARLAPAGTYSGYSYVVFGKKQGEAFDASIDLGALNGSDGFRMEGVALNDQSGTSVSGAGDINGDGISDLLVGAPQADPNGASSGSSYLVFGKKDWASGATPGETLLSELDWTNGFRVDGVTAGDKSGVSISGAGDFNGDGLDDLLIGADSTDYNGTDSGSAYLIFGWSDATPNHLPTGEVTITGNATEGETLTASNSLVDEDGLGDITYQWYADGEPIEGAVSETYTLILADVGKAITVTASYTDDGGAEESVTSAATDPVTGLPDLPDLASLDGNNGFRLDGVDNNDYAGWSVSGAGDVNGDGYDDVIVGAYNAVDGFGFGPGASFVVFGQRGGLPDSLNLGLLDGSSGFRLNGQNSEDRAGYSVSGAGDVNGDGYDDLIMSAYQADPGSLNNAGSSYVIFGQGGGFSAVVNAFDLTGTNGFRLDGVAFGDNAGYAVSSAGDVNGDDYDDLIVGAYQADPGGEINAGSSYVVFGKAGGFTATSNLGDLDGSNGFRLDGRLTLDSAGWSVAGAGDVNGDGYDDLIIGAPGADSVGNASGSTYVIFGKAGGYSATMSLGDLDGTNGFRLDGAQAGDQSGHAVSSAGDVNGDGYDDLIIGAPQADPIGAASGSSYVVFGKQNGFTATMNLAGLNGSNGFRLDGGASGDGSGISVSGAGDVNGDGYDDLLVGAYYRDVSGKGNAGSVYLFYGKATGFSASLGLDSLAVSGGARLEGENADDNFGVSVSGAGDVNGDGRADLIAGAYLTDYSGGSSGTSYVVFGRPSGEEADDLLVEGGPGPDSLDGGAGNDTLVGYGGRDTLQGFAGDDTLDGGDDIDNALFQNGILDYSIVNNSGELTVTGPVNDGEDTLTDTERLHFNDLSLAFDLDGNAGLAARLLGVALGKDQWYDDKGIVGIALDIFDAGLGLEEVAGLALDVLLGEQRTNEMVFTLVWQNVVGGDPPQSEIEYYVPLLDNGTYTQTSLFAAAAEHEINAANINLVGVGSLTELGLEYIPV